MAFEAVDGGVDRACRGADADDQAAQHFMALPEARPGETRVARGVPPRRPGWVFWGFWVFVCFWCPPGFGFDLVAMGSVPLRRTAKSGSLQYIDPLAGYPSIGGLDLAGLNKWGNARSTTLGQSTDETSGSNAWPLAKADPTGGTTPFLG